MRRRIASALVVAATLGWVLTGCGVPADPDGSLDRITGGVLRAGASPSGDLVIVDGGEVSGVLPDVVEEFAAARDARVEWTIDSEEDLVDDLASGRLDVAVGGMTAQTPWAEQVSVTRAYPELPGANGADVVILLPMGENGLQAAIEGFLDEEVG
ncbi:transporter substrate-binding domain-containing protein [Microbacterium sp. SORGH_AS_0862]|uniref:transporter substrate-binding domain-containing protein n=1 Tax=Microbacterium sp. SORGH_AS_0862 TaxID=3041789 RepID=UPI002792AAFB|nr:transporter substrate-binding domain-containing protein [Microbacterium sp. SORGH_AS_0862]MDQ1205569.1 ABC-type amino acid transport substrate-binding protein [Microbacterium sp. SORGH_AS_0862]